MASDPAPHGFTHLHVHSHFTLLGGTASVADLVAQASAQGLTHLALTDTNSLYGAVAFARACQARELQPILGMVATVATPAELAALGAPGAEQVVLLAMGPAGYRSLCRLSSLIQGQPNRETLAQQGLPWDTLATNGEGLLCLAGGRRSHLEHFLRRGDDQTAHLLATRLAETFDDRAYLALEIHRSADVALAEQARQLGERLGLPAVAVQPVYSLVRADSARLRLLAAIDQNRRLDQVPASALPDQGDPAVDLHWLPPPEVARRFAALPGAVAAAGEVASRCEPALPDGRPVWPALHLPPDITPDAALARDAEAGLRARFGAHPQPAVSRRLRDELDAIAGHGYSPLFLVVADIVRFARDNDIPVSTRGSVANSLVAYCMGITTVDPIAHDLLFERFLNPARANPPDIDLDFCSRRRDQVLEHVRQAYDGAGGDPQVALVSTVSTMRPKSAVREVAKAYGLDEASTAALIKRLPAGWHPDPRRRSRKTVEDVAAEVDDLQLRQVLLDAAPLVGQPHHLSVHPGGLVITPGPLTDVVPVQWTAKGFLITQFDAEGVEAIGLPKLDLLGIRALTVLADTAQLVRRHYDPEFRLEHIPLDDPATADMLARGDTIGVFQCESSGAQCTLRQLQARTVQDLAVANAFFKPGPAMGGMARSFVRRYRGEEQVTFLHPALEPILGQTKGVLIFQEQILLLAREIAGLTWEQADHLRRGMSHFGHAEMEALQAVFVAGCLRPPPEGPGLSEQQARTLWDQVLPFAGYGFNQGHATAYADVSYRSAFLKAHWPAAFLAARLADWGGFHHPAIYMAEAVRLGIAVRPPHVNHSGRKFTLQPEAPRQQRPEQGPDAASPTLWMGLGQVRDLRRASVQAILVQRRHAPFTSLRDLLDRVPLQPKEIAHLIQGGALDGLGESRASLLAAARDVARAGNVGQLAFDFAGGAVPPEPAAQRLAWEQFVLGQPVSVHPLDLVRDRLPATTPLAALPSQPQQRLVVAAVRLPGWTGGRGVFIGDGHSLVIAAGPRDAKAPQPWQPHLVHGRWLTDEWGTGWFQVDSWQPWTQ